MEPTQTIPATPALGSTAFPDIVFAALRSLAAGSSDTAENSLYNFRKIFANHISSGLEIAKTGNLTTSSGGGVVIINGAYVEVDPEATFQYQVNTETYNYITIEGDRQRITRQTGQPSPALPTGYLLHSRVITDANAIVQINITGTDTLGNLFHNRAPVSKQQVSPLVGLPTGVYLPYAGTAANVPDGWLLCRGQAVSRTTYSTLFQTIGTQYGAGDGANTFNLPLGPGRVPVNLDADDSNFNAIGKNSGASTHQLTEAQMPQHNHPGSTSVNGHHAHTVPSVAIAAGSTNKLTLSGNAQQITWGNHGTWGAGEHNHSVYTDNRGSNQAHNNVQKSQATLYIIKT